MKYIIVNANKYITDGASPGIPRVVSDIKAARYFTFEEAESVLKTTLKGDSSWGWRRMCTSPDNKNYVITTGTNYVSNVSKSGITQNFKKAKLFRSVSDAETYLQKHKHVFDDPVIITDSCEFVCTPSGRKFSDKQLQQIGKVPDTKLHSRIIIPKSTKEVIYERCGGKCALCGKPINVNDATLDHITPLNRGGTNENSNLQIACKACNQLKNNSSEDEFIAGATNILAYKLTTGAIQKEDLFPLIRGYVRSLIFGSTGFAQTNLTI